MSNSKMGRPEKKMSFISPNGDLVEFFGLSKFCKSHSLPINRMSELANGKRIQYKGWTVSDDHDKGLPVYHGERCKSTMIPVDAYNMAKEQSQKANMPIGIFIADVIELYCGGYLDN